MPEEKNTGKQAEYTYEEYLEHFSPKGDEADEGEGGDSADQYDTENAGAKMAEETLAVLRKELGRSSANSMGQ